MQYNDLVKMNKKNKNTDTTELGLCGMAVVRIWQHDKVSK